MREITDLAAPADSPGAASSPPTGPGQSSRVEWGRPLWPAGAALVLAVAAYAVLPARTTERAWPTFFVLGSLLPLTFGPALVRWSPSQPVRRVVRGLGPLVSVLAIAVGAAFGLARLTSFAAVAAGAQVAAAFFLGRAAGGPHSPGAVDRARRLVVWLAVSLSAWGIAGTLVWWTAVGNVVDTPWGFIVLLTSAVVVLGALWRPDALADRRLAVAATTLALALLAAASVRTNDLFSPGTTINWEFYVGPADLLRQGGWLLWDVPTQYGYLSELSIAWFPVGSPWEALFILNSLASFLLAATVFLVLRSLGRGLLNLVMSFAVALAACFFRPGFSTAFVGPAGFPSAGGFRFVWCVALVALLLTTLRLRSRHIRLAMLLLGNLIWLIGVLWSAESAIYSTLAWIPGYALMVVAEHGGQPAFRHRFTTIAGWFAAPVVLLTCALGIIVLVYRVGLGHGPDLRSFLDFGLTYRSGFGGLPLDLGGPGWVLFLAYVATLMTLSWNIRRRPRPAIAVLVATAAMMYATSSYFVGRSHPANVWNLAPEVCIALAVALGLAGRDVVTDPLTPLIRLISAPIFIMLVTGSVGERASVVDYVSRPQVDVTRIEAALPPTDPDLQTLVQAHVRAGEGVAYLVDSVVDPTLTPHLQAGTTEAYGAPLWLPLVPFTALNLLPPARRATYVERFIARHRDGGWLIETTGPHPGTEWVKDQLRGHFAPGPTYVNAGFQLTFWRASQ